MGDNVEFRLPVLLVDDEPKLLTSVSILLRSSGIESVDTLEDSRGVIPWLQKHPNGVLILDLTMPHLSGQEVLDQVSEDFPEVPVIIMTATGHLDTAVQCMQAGACDYLLKPVEKSRLVSAVSRAMEIRSLREEVSSLKASLLADGLRNNETFSGIVTQNPRMLSIFRYIEAISKSPQPVLITGETGTGKELIARSIHKASGVPGKFIAENIAGLDDSVFADTLFGHKKGAFTSADHARPGLVVEAQDGTLFLDEIGDLKESSQIKLLRLLQERQYYPLGADQLKASNARIVVATNQDMSKLTATGGMRKDLFFRLRAHHIHIPPLKERKADIPLLLNYFIEQAAERMGSTPPNVPRQLSNLLKNHPFPGNVRELESMVYDAIACHDAGILSMRTFKETIGQDYNPAIGVECEHRTSATFADIISGQLPTLKQTEHMLIELAMKHSEGNQGIAAGILGISRQALNKRLLRGKDQYTETG